MSGRLIVFEGGEASGKSTQASRLARDRGALLTREPGGTDIGLKLRTALLDPRTSPLHPRTEALLMAADRAEHVAQVIRPALAEGRDVVCDRFIGSSLAYQGHGRGLDINEVWGLSRFATVGLEADLVVLLDVEVEVAAARLTSATDRIEGAGNDFHQRVRSGYLSLARAEPQRWVVIDGSAAPDDVAASVRSVVDERLGRLQR